MSEQFEGQRGWRERFHMDDNAVQRLGRSVIRAGVSLPFVLLYGLMPKPEGAHLAQLLAVGFAVVGLGGIMKMRTWGMVAMGISGVLVAGHLSVQTAILGAMLIGVATPFARPMHRWIAHA